MLLDGFPRTLAQAEGLTRFSNVQLAINLHIDEQVRLRWAVLMSLLHAPPASASVSGSLGSSRHGCRQGSCSFCLWC